MNRKASYLETVEDIKADQLSKVGELSSNITVIGLRKWRLTVDRKKPVTSFLVEM